MIYDMHIYIYIVCIYIYLYIVYIYVVYIYSIHIYIYIYVYYIYIWMNVRGYVYEGFQNNLWIGVDLSYWLVDKDSQFPRMPPCQRDDAKWLQAPRVQPMAQSLMTRQQSDPCCIRDFWRSSHVFHSPQRLQCSPNLWHGSNGPHTFNIRGI